MQRRRLLAALGAGVATAGAGCSSLPFVGGGLPGGTDAPGEPNLAYDVDAEVLGRDPLSIGPDGRRYFTTRGSDDSADSVIPTTYHSVAEYGENHWAYHHPEGVGPLVVGPELVYMGVDVALGMEYSGPTAVEAHRPMDLVVEWSVSAPGEQIVDLFDAAGGRVVGGTTKTMHDEHLDDWRFALSGADGSIAWQREDDEPTAGVVADGSLYLAYGGKNLTACDVADGEQQWYGDSWGAEVAVAGDRVIAGPRPLTACDLTGETRWVFDEQDDPEGTDTTASEWAISPDETTVYTEASGGGLAAIDVETGTVRWQFTAAGGTELTHLLAGDETVWCVAGEEVVAVDASGPPAAWRTTVGGGAHGFERTDATVFLSWGPDGETRHLTAIDADSGEPLWTRTAAIADVAGAPETVGTVSVALRDGRLYTVTASQPIPHEG